MAWRAFVLQSVSKFVGIEGQVGVGFSQSKE